ncbi:hypothetical protein JG688_00013880 [Phytophthora aleatoria]|uniref:Uncharacterized protein n=1 Tax=Phytophthora aleatoria TaxID=2496075 RepID=A0A8J5I8B5_9STRA|nr:hypothetical protein JG688_00013880 [Phytophthora aleatoria]
MLAMTQTPPTTTAETGRDSKCIYYMITSEPSKSSPSRCHGRMSTSRAYKAWLRCKSMIWKRSANRHGRCRRHRGFKQQIELSPKRKPAFDLWNAFRCTAQSFTQVVSVSDGCPRLEAKTQFARKASGELIFLITFVTGDIRFIRFMRKKHVLDEWRSAPLASDSLHWIKLKIQFKWGHPADQQCLSIKANGLSLRISI